MSGRGIWFCVRFVDVEVVTGVEVVVVTDGTEVEAFVGVKVESLVLEGAVRGRR